MTTPPDFDRLSAYLDKQLAPAETAALEQRLAREPELQATLDELRANARRLAQTFLESMQWNRAP